MFRYGLIEIILGVVCLLFIAAVVAGIIVMATKKPRDP
jgi:flagellar basal body-associated protein FliL